MGHYSRFFGVLASAVLYAIAQPTIADAFIAFIVGWYLAIVTLRYHSIRPARQIHFSVLLFTWLLELVPQSLLIIPVILVAIVFLIAGFSLFGRKINYHLVRIRRGETKLWKIVFTSSTILICILLFITGVILTAIGY